MRLDGESCSAAGLCVAGRAIGLPKPRTVLATVPYGNAVYDYSLANGRMTFEPREATYEFDVAEASPQEAEAARRRACAWLMRTRARIEDETVPGRYLVGSTTALSYDEDDSGLGGTVKAVFTCDPLWYSEADTEVAVNGSAELLNGGQPVTLYAKAPAGGKATAFGKTVTLPASQAKVPLGTMPTGAVQVTTTAAMTLMWREEAV